MSFSRGVSQRKRYSYDQRTGLKVFRPDRMREDGERSGIMTLDWDDEHPQRHLSIPPADRAHYLPGTPDPAAIPVTVRIGRMWDSSSSRTDHILSPYIGLAPVVTANLGVTIS